MHCCKTLSQLLKNGNLRSSSEVRIISDTLTLNETLSIASLTDIALVGNTLSTITCLPHTGAGLVFANVSNLIIGKLKFFQCGTLQNGTSFDFHNKNTILTFQSTLYIVNVTNMNITNVSVRNTNGTGVAIFDTIGQVTISNSNFTDNRVQQSKPAPGGGGLYIEFTYCTPGTYNLCHPTTRARNTHYTLTHCIFSNNNATTPYPNETSLFRASKSYYDGFGRGGGLHFVVKGLAANNVIDIIECTFENNSAIWGGGLYIVFQDSATYHNFCIQNCTFTENRAYLNGGGGAKIGYLLPRDTGTTDNNISFINCVFERNSAKQYGGGTVYFSSRGIHQNITKNYVRFIQCNWTENTAFSGSAVDVGTASFDIYGNGLLPTPRFNNNIFDRNQIQTHSKSLGAGVKQYLKGQGAFLVSNTHVILKGYNRFYNNSGTAIYLTSATLDISGNAVFRENNGKYGGAIAFIGYSVVYVNRNTIMNFTANRASIQGGALYQFSYDKHEFVASRSCFIQYNSSDDLLPEKRNITLYFKDNRTPNGDGDAVFATSIKPCRYGCPKNYSKSANHRQAFQCIGTLVGQKSTGRGRYNISTVARTFRYVRTNLTAIIPGKQFTVPLIAFNENNQSKEIVYKALMESGKIKLDRSSKQVTTNGTMQLHGKQGNSGPLLLQYADASVWLNVTMAECPPGYRLGNDSQNMLSCQCAAQKFLGLSRCSQSRYQAIIQRGYWIGKCNNGELCTGECPPGFCTYKESNTGFTYLPQKASQLEDFICGDTRQGILCGQCKDNHSVYYHSYTYTCDVEDKCHIGILFYIMAELIPLTIVFIAIMVFDINFTSGSATGFILFAQVIDSLSVTANGAIQFSRPLTLLTVGHRFIYRFFNMDFFSVEQLSFCPWKGATVLDVMALKYVTICYAFILVLCTIFLMRTGLCLRLCSCLRIQTLKSAVIHGLSAFFVMCYSQCARVSIQILYPKFLYRENIKHADTVLFRSGQHHLFDASHLKYAIPAVFFLITIVIAPPLLLLLYPLSYKLLGRCKLSESKVLTKISRLIPIQLLDSFQACYHDNLRFFAGLYFLYRTMTLALYALSKTLIEFYTLVEFQLVIILAVHAAVQPYKKRWHNVIESVIFADLAIVNGITLYNYAKTQGTDDIPISSIIDTASAIQVALIYLPVVIIIAFLLRKLYKKFNCKKWCTRQRSDSEYRMFEDSSELPPLRTPGESVHLAKNLKSVYSDMCDV